MVRDFSENDRSNSCRLGASGIVAMVIAHVRMSYIINLPNFKSDKEFYLCRILRSTVAANTSANCLHE